MGAYEYQSVAFMMLFVSTNGDDAVDGRSWATAKATIQAGVDCTVPGGVVWVTTLCTRPAGAPWSGP